MANRPNTRLYDPPLGFYFRVKFEDLANVTEDFRFQSVSGLSMEVVTETHKEGGNNQYDHVLPVKTQYPDLILKRGLWILDTGEAARNETGSLQAWCHQTIQSLIVRPSTVSISLLNPGGRILMTWSVRGAWPKKWSVSDFNAEESAVVIETIELNYNYFTITG